MAYLPDFNPRNGLYVYSHLLGVPATGAGDPAFGTVSGTGASTASTITTATNRPGIWRSTTGTTTTGRAAISCSVGGLAVGGGPIDLTLDVKFPILSALAERYQFIVGLFDTLTAINQVDAVAFVYDEGGVATGSAASANWQAHTASNSNRTWTTGSVAVSTDTFQRLKLSINADGSSVAFYVGSTLIATHTTNIPTGVARALGFGWLNIKSLGTTTRDADVDFFEMIQNFTTPS